MQNKVRPMKEAQMTRHPLARHLPKPPSPVPWFTLGTIMVMSGLYALFEGWAWIGLVIVVFSPFVSVILPMEIRDFIQRKRICALLRRDFMGDTEIVHDHTNFLKALHAERFSPASSRRTSSEKLWPSSGMSASSGVTY